ASPPDGRGRAKRWYWGFYIGMALATLTKGPVGVLVPLLAVIPYLLLTGRWREVARECRLLPGTAVFLLIAAPWYAAMVLLHGAAITLRRCFRPPHCWSPPLGTDPSQRRVDAPVRSRSG